ncbi:acyltransferase family protein, partial [Pediococcus pentosaceus]
MKRINYGIELGRILTMIMVMVLHILQQGGILRQVSLFSFKGQTMVLLEYLCIVAVNVFALITGYVMVNGKYKPKRLLSLWLQVIFYSYVILICVYPFKHITLKNLLTLIFPTLFKEYWYFNAYLILFLFIPLINIGIKMLSKESLLKLIIFIFAILSIVGSLTKGDSLYLQGGYSPIWLMYAYIVGAYMKLHSKKGNYNKKNILVYLVLAVTMLALHDCVNLVLQVITGSSSQFWFL